MTTLNDTQKSPRTKLTLLVLAAGMGSRFGGLKQIAALGPSGETVLEYSVYDAIRAGFDRVVFVVRKDFEEQFRSQIVSRFADRVNVALAFQDLDDLPAPFTAPCGRAKPWGTAHAVLAARKEIDSPFAVINADDFYGADAYVKLAQFLRNTSTQSEPAHFCMVAYELGRTLSEHGTVSRGVCKVSAESYLESITEREKIRASATGPEAFINNAWEPLPADAPVSMNMMGFTPALFPMLEERFSLFLKERGNDPKAECYLPESVTYSLNHGWATVNVLRTSGQWMGITYPGDKDAFTANVRRFCDAGEYASPLWRK
jgi:choline kinase